MASMLAGVRRWFFTPDPLIAQAERRMWRRRSVVAASIVLLAAGGALMFFGLHGGGTQPVARGGTPGLHRVNSRPAAPDHVVINVFGQPSPPAEVAGRPFDKTLALFRSSRLAAALPAPSGQMGPLASVAARTSGDPGALRLGETRRVATAAGSIYLVPTTHGWACVQGQRFETCQRGLLPQGIAWHVQSATNGVDVVGIASDDVSGVVYAYGKAEQQALLHDNVFFVHLPVALKLRGQSLPLGTLTISYRDGRPKARVPLR